MDKLCLVLVLASLGCALPRPAPPARCGPPAPLRVVLATSFCGLHARKFYWDGGRCAEVDGPALCTCGLTVDCAPYYASREACEDAHARCF